MQGGSDLSCSWPKGLGSLWALCGDTKEWIVSWLIKIQPESDPANSAEEQPSDGTEEGLSEGASVFMHSSVLINDWTPTGSLPQGCSDLPCQSRASLASPSWSEKQAPVSCRKSQI
jgi:hypothetical protein